MTKTNSSAHEAEVRDVAMMLALLIASGSQTARPQVFVPSLFISRPR